MASDHDRPITILAAEDDEDDFLLIRQVLEGSQTGLTLRHVQDGQDLLDYLRREGRYSDPSQAPSPDLILLDLNMPRMDGREALQAIKSDPQLKAIPVVILTTSKAEEDVQAAYRLGVNSYVKKPSNFEKFEDAVSLLRRFWLQTAELPSTRVEA